MASLAEQIIQFEELRAHAEPLPTDSAAYTTSAFFKSKSAGPGNSKAKPWDHRLSVDSRAQGSSPLKTANRGKNMDMITLGTARPSPQFYPYESLTINCVDDASAKDNKPTTAITCSKGDSTYNLAAALNYGFPAGSPQSVRFITEHVEMIHNPPYEDWKSSLTCGTTSGLEMVFRIFCNPGDNILVEKYSYTGTVVAARAQRLKTLPIGMDEFGLSATELDVTLENWDQVMGPKPYVLYTIPTGQNPTGVTQSLERRKEIYKVAEKHDLIIVEDDPYFFLQLGEPPKHEYGSQEALQEYRDRLPSSYLSLDVSGRVVRLDSTSKILSPGLRLGWLTACSQIVDLFEAYSEVSVLAPSGPSQVMMYKLLDQTWGHTGFVKWLAHLSQVYSNRLNMMLQACEEQLPKDVCTWRIPDSGMFVWISVDVSKHPRSPSGVPTKEFQRDIEGALYEKSRDNGVLISQGSWFLADPTQADEAALRVTFAAATEPELKPGIERLGKAVREEFGLA
ncbi:hypothetical protein NQ176_g1381 [Zarea fungicola]|uniref:Uncharacterized protein n=1 Tax=Zarea fungicola TaxID=93591 RepID=A0ACC1NVV4_9HYPO|nr:hypothetical protein NQ176_g1381 [Lecanicillium fungicola]